MSQSPKRATSKGKSADDILLEKRIEAHRVSYPQNLLLAVGGLASFFPVYVGHALFDMLWTSLLNIPVFLVVMAATAAMLSKAYGAMAKTEFLKRQRHYDETKSEADASALRDLRLQAALAYTMFFVNVVFVGAVALLQTYVLRATDARISYASSSLVGAAIVWFITQKNEESKRRN
jgi:hypothetical protein